MNDFRAVLAIFLSCISTYLLADLFLSGFSWSVLIAAMLGYFLVHLIWPKKQTSDSAWYDFLELIFDLPYRVMASMIRGLGSIFRNTDIDISG